MYMYIYYSYTRLICLMYNKRERMEEERIEEIKNKGPDND